MPEQFILANMSDKLIFFTKITLANRNLKNTYIWNPTKKKYSTQTPSWYYNEQKVSWPHELLSPELSNEDRLLPDTYITHSGLKIEKCHNNKYVYE